MSIQILRHDYSAFKGQALVKRFSVYKLENGTLVPYDTTGKDIYYKAYDRVKPVANILYTIAVPTTAGLGFIEFTFDSTETNQPSITDYVIEEVVGAGYDTLLYGSANFIDIGSYIAYRDIVQNETPAGLVIPESYINIKTYEWRRFMQNAVDPHIADVDFNNETAWPQDLHFLIAKLVVYDYLVKSMKSLIAQNDATDEGNSVGVKRIETGPSNAEFFDTFKSLGDFLKLNGNGQTVLDVLSKDICVLAGRLRVQIINICPPLIESTTVFTIVTPDRWVPQFPCCSGQYVLSQYIPSEYHE